MTAPVVTPVESQPQNFNSVAQFASGSFATDAGTPADYTIALGFKPRLVVVMNVTDTLRFEWMEGVANPGSISSVAAGDMTLNATEASGITILGAGTAGGTAVAMVADPGLLPTPSKEITDVQGGTVGYGFTIDEAIMVASKTFSWYALG
jgi:hypothetical protein